ncbi:MAG: RNA methyltransferase [Candidatus Omnitrophota bacterium]
MKLYGKNPVIERIKSDPKSVRKIFIQDGFSDAEYIRRKAKQWSIPLFSIPRSKMLKIARSMNTQGILADIEDYSYIPYDELLNLSFRKHLCLVFLDGLKDPQNLGAMIRSLACFGGFALVLPTHDSVEVTEAVLRVASGGENFVLIAKVSNLAQAIRLAKEHGFWIAGGVVQGGQDLMKTALTFPLSLVIGSEQKGIREALQKLIDLPLTLPMKQAQLSFNVAQATSIFCYEITKQKNQKKASVNASSGS